MTVFQPGSEKAPAGLRDHSLSDADNLRARFGQAFDDALESMELAVGASAEWNHDAFLKGKLTPCSSAPG